MTGDTRASRILFCQDIMQSSSSTDVSGMHTATALILFFQNPIKISGRKNSRGILNGTRKFWITTGTSAGESALYGNVPSAAKIQNRKKSLLRKKSFTGWTTEKKTSLKYAGINYGLYNKYRFIFIKQTP